MESLFNLFNSLHSSVTIAGIICFLIIGILSYVLIGKMDEIEKFKTSLKKMSRSFNDLDEQAKLIVRTDLELNKAQEELERRLNSLNALQKTSRLISTTLDEDEIFHRLEQPLITELGFEKSIILIFDTPENLHCRIVSGFSNEEISHIISHLIKERDILSTLKEGYPLSSTSASQEKRTKISQFFNSDYFIITPILTQDGVIGILFVGNQSGASIITEGDEELISILTHQIGQSLENAYLFEQVYRSRQELELKIQERTKQLSVALEEVNQISKTKSEFISAVSHELRTPLTSIKGYASILMSGKLGGIPQPVKDRLKKINNHSDNLVKMINDLLDISRIESGRVEMNFIKQEIPPLIENVKDLLTPQIKEKNLIFKTQISDTLPEIYLDKSHVERVLINLISNAIKFTPKKGKINIKIQLDKNDVLFSISDTGIGIKEEALDKIFDEFYRVENEINQNLKGTGLGLALAKKILEAHGGKIWVTSKINAGTIFHFTLPVKSENTSKEKVK